MATYNELLQAGIPIVKTPGFRPWVQKVMPGVYDDTLSYYELLSKVVAYLNQMNDQQNEIIDWLEVTVGQQDKDIEMLKKAFITFRGDMVRAFEEFKKDVLDNVLGAKLGEILQEWYDNGKLAEIINKDVFDMKADKTYVDEQFTLLKYYANVKDTKYGAKGDGETDDSDAFQKAFNETKSIIIPSGTYFIDKIVTITGKTISAPDGVNTTILFGPNGGFDVSGHFNRISNIRITSKDKNNRAKYGLLLKAPRYSMFENIHLSFLKDGILTEDLSYSHSFRDCTAIYCDIGFNIKGNENNNLAFNRCVALENRINMMFGNLDKNTFQFQVTVRDCNIEQSDETGVFITSMGKISLRDNYLENNNRNKSADVSKGAVYVGDLTASGRQPYRFEFTGNYLFGNKIGFDLSASTQLNYTIENNVFRTLDIGQYAVHVNGVANSQFHRVHAQGNSFDNRVIQQTNNYRGFKNIEDGCVVDKMYYYAKSFYVDSVGGNDDNDGSSNAPLKTTDRAIQLMPDLVNAKYSIVLRNGVYPPITIQGKHGFGSINVIADVGASPVMNGTVEFKNCTAPIIITGVEFKSTENKVPLYVDNCKAVEIKNTSCTSESKSTNDAFYFTNGSTAVLSNVTAKNFRHMFKANNGSNINVSGVTSEDNDATFGVVAGGIISRTDRSGGETKFVRYGTVVPPEGYQQMVNQPYTPVDPDTAQLRTDLNSLITKLINAGYMVKGE